MLWAGTGQCLLCCLSHAGESPDFPVPLTGRSHKTLFLPNSCFSWHANQEQAITREEGTSHSHRKCLRGKVPLDFKTKHRRSCSNVGLQYCAMCHRNIQDFLNLKHLSKSLCTFAQFKEEILNSSSWQGSSRFAGTLSKQQEGKSAPLAQFSDFGREIEHSILLRLFLPSVT